MMRVNQLIGFGGRRQGAASSCPTGTYAGWDSGRNSGNTITTSLQLDNNITSASYTDANTPKTTGKWYFEVTVVAVGSPSSYSVGISGHSTFTRCLSGTGTKGVQYRNDGNKYIDGTTSSGLTTWTSVGHRIGVALDADTGKVWFKDRNGAWITATNDADVAAGNNPDATLNQDAGFRIQGDFGGNTNHTDAIALVLASASFSHSMPTGFCEWRDT